MLPFNSLNLFEDCFCLLSFEDTKKSLPRSFLPSLVPSFTGRQNECQEIIGYVTSESARIVSIWGSPGFGKTSVAIAVGHKLQSQGLPVCFLSLRSLQSVADLKSKFLRAFRQFTTNHQSSALDPEDEFYQLVSEISEGLVVVLDNADDLLESGLPNVKTDVVRLLEEILWQNEKLTLIVTTRESFEFMNLHFQGHKSLRVGPLDGASSKALVHELLPTACTSDCNRVTQICGHVPLAIKLLCSLISDDTSQTSQFLDDFMGTDTESIAEMLDNPDYPADHRLQVLFDSSFQRLSAQERKALVSLCILPENFGTEVAAAVLGNTRILETKKILRRLWRKSLIESNSKSGSYSMHKLVQSFAREKGKHQMSEILHNSKRRFFKFHVSRFKELNEEFLTGHSMSAFIAYYENDQSLLQSLEEGCLDPEIADDVFEILVEAELFLGTLYFLEGEKFSNVYNSAIKAASQLEKTELYARRLLVSQAFEEVSNSEGGSLMHLLPLPLNEDRGKSLCYSGICQLVSGNIESGIHCLEESSLLLNDSPEQTVLKLVIFHILVVYYNFQNNLSSSSDFYNKALQICNAVGDTQLLLVSPMEDQSNKTDNEKKHQEDTKIVQNQPLKLLIIYLLCQASKYFCDTETQYCQYWQYCGDFLRQTLREIETKVQISFGLFNFYRKVLYILATFNQVGDQVRLYEERVAYHETALKKNSEMSGQRHREALAKCYYDLGMLHYSKNNYQESLQAHQRGLDLTLTLFGEEHASTADCYHELGTAQHALGDYTSALQSKQHALDVRRKLFGEKHVSTAYSYHILGITQLELGHFNLALRSHNRALNIRRTLFEEQHASTADSYQAIAVTQFKLCDLSSALQSLQRSLDIFRKLYGEEHSRTAASYYLLGVTQHELCDFHSALQSKQRALDVRRKLFGEEHANTAYSHHAIGVTQHRLGDYTSALQSHKQALDVRRKLFGEEHADTANSYHEIGVAQDELGDYPSALQSHKQALDVRRKLFGEEHANTADSYHLLGVTQYELGDYTSALQSHKHAFDVRRKLFGEKHTSIADSYHEIGVTQHELGDYTSALQSKQQALDVRRKLFGEEHANTADCYYSLGVTQHQLGDYNSALHSYQHALDVRRNLFGEEHEKTADSYRSLGVTQHELGDYPSALQSKQQALDVRRKLFGEEHGNTADCYHSLGVTQHELGDYTSALQSHQRALDVRRKLLGEEHGKTANSDHSLGVTQFQVGDFNSALQSHQRALDVRRKLLGEEHTDTAESYHEIGITQYQVGDFNSALQSHQRALDVRRKLLGEEHADTADSYHEIGVTQLNLGDYNSALQSFQHASDVRRKLFGKEHRKTANIDHSLGITQLNLGDYTSALQSHQRALDVRRKLFGEEHADTANSYHSLGMTQLNLGDYNSALQSFQHALDVRRKLFGEEHVDTANSYHSLGIIQLNLGDYNSALQSFQHASDVRRKLFGEEHTDTVHSYLEHYSGQI